MYLKFCNTRSSVRTTDLIKRGCKHRLFKDAVAKVRQIPCSTALEASIKNESHRIPFVITFNPASSHFQQPQQSSFFTTVPRSTFFFTSYIVPALQKPTRRTGQGQTLQAISPPSPPLPGFGSFMLSQKQVQDVSFHYRGNHILHFFSLPRNKDAYDITSPALLPISFICYIVTNVAFNIYAR